MRKQKTALLTQRERDFISAVQDSLSKADTSLTDDPTLHDKLTGAFLEARAIGIARDELLAHFIYLEIQAPGFHRHPSIRRWLRKTGAVPEERFSDLIEVLRHKSQQLQESK
ncbi:hypothetical protein [Trinickia sp.]|uniref:hypothetical protein n=1 Tax=Trinickia sp. TaxID=2571163 RepID=UPI003F813E76